VRRRLGVCAWGGYRVDPPIVRVCVCVYVFVCVRLAERSTCVWRVRQHGLEAVEGVHAEHEPLFEAGSRVMTLYGCGVVAGFRPRDGVYEVSDQHNTFTCYMACLSSALRPQTHPRTTPHVAIHGPALSSFR
jgi:hypothetical protein